MEADCLQRRMYRVPITVAILFAAFSPISNNGIWWDLARGHAVLSGSITPARDLLANEHDQEADWLGGVPTYVGFRLSGFVGLSLSKLILAWGLLLMLLRPCSRQDAVPICIVGVGILAAADAFDSISRSLDLVGMLVVGTLLDQSDKRASGRTLISLFLTMLLWANIARFPILGVLLAIQHVTLSRSTQRNFILLMVVCLTTCLTPRGFGTIWDSLRLLVPRLTQTSATLSATEFRPTILTPWDGQVLAYAVVCLIAAACLIRFETKWPRVAICFLMMGIGCSSHASLAPAAIWLTASSLACQPHSFARNLTTTSRHRVVVCSLSVLFAVGVAGALWPGQRAHAGWGLAPKLDIRLFEASLKNCRLKGTAHCFGLRSAGMLAWTIRSKSASEVSPPQPDDVPHRALLGGRLGNRVLLQHDLETEIRNPQRREDGSWAGWWIPLKDNQTSLLCVPAERTKLIHSLEPTLWKPLSLDAQVIPFGRAGDPMCAKQLIRVLQEREFVDQGEWSYSPPVDDNLLQHGDLWNLLTGDIPWQTPLRQARVFRAMNLHHAAIRVLKPIVELGNNRVLLEFARNRTELEWTERLNHDFPSSRLIQSKEGKP